MQRILNCTNKAARGVDPLYIAGIGTENWGLLMSGIGRADPES